MRMKLLRKLSTRTTTGILSKGIYKDKNGIMYFVKGNSSQYTYEPYSEYMASKLIKKLGIKCIDYLLEDKFYFPEIVTHGDCFHVSICKVYNKSLRQFYTYISRGDKFYNTEPIDAYIALGLDKQWLLDLFVIDALIGNQDRHLNNFDIEEDEGEIRNAPILDVGASLLYDVIDKDLRSKEATSKSMNKCRPFLDEETNHIDKILAVKERLNLIKWLDLPLKIIQETFKEIPLDIRKIIGENRVHIIEQTVIERTQLLNDLNKKGVKSTKWI